MKAIQSLATLNNAEPNRLADALRSLSLAGYDKSLDKETIKFGDLLNKVIALANQGSNSVAASQTATVAGVPATNDVITITLDGTAYAYTIADGTSATTAAAGMVTFLNANTTFSKRYSAANAAGVITVTAKRKGTAMNGKTFACAKTGAGGTTFTAGGATIAGGTLLDDILPVADV